MKNKLTAYSFLFTVCVLILITFALPDNTVSKIIFLGTLSFIYGLYVSIYASKKKCRKISKFRSIFHGIRNSVIIVLSYFAITKLPILSQPVSLVISDDKIASFVSSIIILLIICNILTHLTYKASVKKVCNVCGADIESNLKKYNEYLARKNDDTNNTSDIRIAN